MAKLRILILGTGGMARQHVMLLREDSRVEITGASDVDLGRRAKHLPIPTKFPMPLAPWKMPSIGASSTPP